ncbi:MAG: dihydroneopterin aldolase [Oceanospirillaceae bacterium]|jgi:dihydroneopterin aldolase
MHRPMNKLWVKGMRFHAFHGCLDEEAKLGGTYQVDVCIGADYALAATEDDLTKTADYEQVFKLTEAEMLQRSKLIEAVAMRISISLRVAYPWSEDITVKLTKFNPPIDGRRITEAEIEWNWSR